MNIYSKRFLFIIRILSALAICLFAISMGLEFYNFIIKKTASYNFTDMFGFYANLLSLVLCCFLIVFPEKIGLIGIISLFYSFWINFVEPDSVIPVFMYFLAVSIFLLRRFFVNHLKLKIIITALLYIFIVLFPLVISDYNIIEVLFTKAAFTFGLIILYVVISAYRLKPEEDSPEKKAKEQILNIADYKNLTERDCQWLNSILNNEKYESIAINHNMSLGSVKNRLKVIFQTLQVGDKIGFLNKYSHHKIVFMEEDTPDRI